MDQSAFDQLQANVYFYSKLGGERLRTKLSVQNRQYLDTTIGILLSKSNKERGEMLANLVKKPEYQYAIGIAIGAALDFLEAQVGQPLDLSSINFTAREHALIRAMLDGVLNGVRTPTTVSHNM
jgi:hypothetical protein